MAEVPGGVNPYAPPSNLGDDAGRSAAGRGLPWLIATLVVVVVCALGAAVLSVPHVAGPYAPAAGRVVFLALNTIFGTLLGFGLTAAVKAALRRDWRLFMPGHWRALETLTVLIGIMASLPWRGQPGFTIGISAFFMEQLASETARNIAGVALYATVAFLTRERIWWKVYAWVWLVSYLASLLQIPIALYNARADVWLLYLIVGALPWISALGACVGTLFVVMGVVGDIRDKVPRDVGHYAGLILPIVTYVMIVIASVML